MQKSYQLPVTSYQLPVTSHKSAFTLVELAIVLVIIGLIIGGVLVGRDLIESASIRAQISQIEKYQLAVNTFRLKYGYLPGDIKEPDASQFGFIARGSYPATGDGNGKIEGFPAVGSPPSGSFNGGGEPLLFWTDLSAAKLIDGSFTSSAGNYDCPFMDYNVTAYFPRAIMGQSTFVTVMSQNYEHFFAVYPVSLLSFCIGYSLTLPPGAGFTVAQASAIDRKMDDGVPDSGAVLAAAGIAPGGGGYALRLLGLQCRRISL